MPVLAAGAREISATVGLGLRLMEISAAVDLAIQQPEILGSRQPGHAAAEKMRFPSYSSRKF